MKAQISVETLLLIGFALTAVGVVFLISNTTSQETIAINKINSSVTSLAKGVDQVYSLGPGSKVFIEIDLPSNVREKVIQGKIIGFKVGSKENPSEISIPTKAPLVGDLPLNPGPHKVLIQMLDNGFVRIGEGLMLTPNKVNKVIPPISGQNTAIQEIKFLNGTDVTLTNLSRTLTGDLNSANTNFNKNINSLNSDQNDSINATFTVPLNEPSKTWNGEIQVNSTQNFKDVVKVSILIPQVLTSIDVNLYSDSSYSIPSTSFTPNSTVYYAIALKDQSNKPIDLTDLNIKVSDPNLVVQQNLSNQSSSNGRVEGSYTISCLGKNGNWGIKVDGKKFSIVTASKQFLVAGGNQSNYFKMDWNNTVFSTANKIVETWKIENTGCTSINITDMNVMWWNDSDNSKLNRVRIANNIKWSGTVSPGSWLSSNAVFSDFNLSVGQFISSNNKLEFDQDMNNNGERFQAQFKFSDGSVYTSPLWIVTGSESSQSGNQVQVIIEPEQWFEGYVQSAQPSINWFGGAEIYSGYYGISRFIGGIQFDLTAIPVNARIQSAAIRLFVQNTSLATSSSKQWNVYMLNSLEDSKFDGTRNHPTYSELNNAVNESTIGILSRTSLVKDTWSELQFNSTQMLLLEGHNNGNNKVSFKITGPTSGTNLMQWDTGYSGCGGGTLGIDCFKPRLVVTYTS